MDLGSMSSASPVSTSGSLVPGDRILSIKPSISGIGFDEQYAERLEDFVNIVHNTITHAYSLSKYIFLRAFEDDRNFNKASFSEVWFLSVDYPRGRADEAIATRCEFIATYLEDYLTISPSTFFSTICTH